jgi:hypothetical protein
MVNNVSLTDIQIKHPGGANPAFAKILLNELDSIAEKPMAYPEFSMFHELPAWGIYIRHAKDIEIKNLILSCERKDYRTAIVLDDVHHSQFIAIKIKESGSGKTVYQYRSTENIIK